MSDLSVAKVGVDLFYFKDAAARRGLAELETRISAVRVGDLWAAHDRFLIFDFSSAARRAVRIRAGTYIRLDITDSGVTSHRALEANSDTVFDLAQMMHLAADGSAARPGEINGRDFYLYLVPDGENGVTVVASLNSTYPNDIDPLYTAANTRKIGQFHTLCADADDASHPLTGTLAASPGSFTTGDVCLVKRYKDDGTGFHSFYSKSVASVSTGSLYDTVTVSHPLAGFRAGDILPESVFCLTFRPYSGAEGMVYDSDTGIISDVYLQSGKGLLTRSEFGATITDTRPQQNHQDDMFRVGKRLMRDYEFSSAAAGSNERTNIYGSADPAITGGHKDSSGRRMLSFIGCEDMCGAMWQWLDDVSANYLPSGDSVTYPAVYDGQGSFGSQYYRSLALIAGGDWSAGASCGSRCRSANNARSNAYANVAGRGVSRVIRGA